jgi:hypothetical protein
VRISCKLLALALASLTLVGAAGAQTTLRYQFKEGEKLPYSLEQDQKMTMKFGGMDIDMKVKLVFDVTMNTLKVDSKGTAQVKATIGRVKMTMDGTTGMATIDSEDKTEPTDPIGQIMAPVIKGLANLEMTYTMDPSGTATNVAFSEASLKKLKELGDVNKLVGDMFSPDSLKSTLASGFVLPAEPVEKGKSWTQKTNEKSSIGKLTGETKYTYDGEVEKSGKKLARILSMPTLKIEADPNAPLKMNVKESTGKGTILFDNSTGRLVESTTEVKMKVEMEVANMAIPGTVVVTTTQRLKDSDDSKK